MDLDSSVNLSVHHKELLKLTANQHDAYWE